MMRGALTWTFLGVPLYWIQEEESIATVVIYVKPGYEANLDSLIQDTIRLTLSTKENRVIIVASYMVSQLPTYEKAGTGESGPMGHGPYINVY
ncbi:hypothetical protein CCACVL1_16133 [Corchorus capsularis]|uniref:Uncharacterized protein n=1 Tax=Corchorus capsularis TaxID=210143 RepID=A0A1R3HZA1_COCAP|nr:hypothetical protein CCACVL1_16133 [Corchorus capsularis]